MFSVRISPEDESFIKYILKVERVPFINHLRTNGLTLLSYAVSKGYVGCTNLLITQGARLFLYSHIPMVYPNPEVPGKCVKFFRRTALYFAALYRHLHCSRLLLTCGAGFGISTVSDPGLLDTLDQQLKLGIRDVRKVEILYISYRNDEERCITTLDEFKKIPFEEQYKVAKVLNNEIGFVVPEARAHILNVFDLGNANYLNCSMPGLLLSLPAYQNFTQRILPTQPRACPSSAASNIQPIGCSTP